MTTEVGSELNARPLLQRQVDALADWLAKDHWTLTEAAALLAGFVPSDTDGSERCFGAWLPGREPWPHREAWEWTVGRDIDDMRQRLATIPNLGFKAPKEIVGVAIKAGAIPPWLAVAKDDPACVELLPTSAFDIGAPDTRNHFRQAQKKKRSDQLESDDKTKLIVGAGRDAFDKIAAVDFEGYRHKKGTREGRVNRRALAGAMLAHMKTIVGEDDSDLPQIEALVVRVRDWLPADADRHDMNLPGTS